MLENLNLGTETLVLLGLGAGGFMFGPKKGGMASFAKLASIGLLGLGVGNATGVFTVSKLKGMLGLNGTAGAFATTTTGCPTGTIGIQGGQCYDYSTGQTFYPAQLYQYQQQQYYDPYQYQQYQQYQQPYSYSNYYPQYYPQGQQYYYPYQQQQYQSYPYQYPTYQQYQQQTYSPLSTCMQTCQQMYQY